MGNRHLIGGHIQGGLDSDKEKILKNLSEDCVITESYGSIYKGKESVSNWIASWLDVGNTVAKWDIISFFPSGNISFFEWTFECYADGKNNNLEGISIVKNRDDKIYHIREYKTKK